MNNRGLFHTGGVLPMIIRVIIAGTILLAPASDVVSAFGLQLVKKGLMRKSEMTLSQGQIATRSNIPTIDLSQPDKFETATFGLG